MDVLGMVHGERHLGSKAPPEETYSKGSKNDYEKASWNRVRLTCPNYSVWVRIQCFWKVQVLVWFEQGHCPSNSASNHFPNKATPPDYISFDGNKQISICTIGLRNIIFRTCSVPGILGPTGSGARIPVWYHNLTPTRCSFSHWNISQFLKI